MTDTDIKIPEAALEKGARKVADEIFGGWEKCDDGDKNFCRGIARAAFRAIVGAWEGAVYCRDYPQGVSAAIMFKDIILPLHTENDNG